jgi:hypothetical protein
MRSEFITFKELFLRNRWVNYTPVKVDEFFNLHFDRMNESFNGTLDTIIKALEEKINAIKALSKL